MMEASDNILLEGWVMKKRRRRMQGWAKRYLKLDATGVLSYYSQPGSTSRGSLKVAESVINVNPKRRAIDIGTFIGSGLLTLA